MNLLLKKMKGDITRALRRVKEVWNSTGEATIFGLKRSPYRTYPFELYFNSDVCVIVFVFF